MPCTLSIRRWCLAALINSKRTGVGVGVQLNSIRQIHRNYYDSLGLTPKASQADVKQAYYKLSLKYHPDKSSGQGEKFREITAAYEVLGNLKLRRLYDRGALHGGHPPPPETDHESSNLNTSSFEARTAQQRAPSTGRTREFNFDDWSKAHYGKVFTKEETRKKKMAAEKQMEEFKKDFQKLEFGILSLLFLISLLFGVTAMVISSSHDRPKKYDKSVLR